MTFAGFRGFGCATCCVSCVIASDDLTADTNFTGEVGTVSIALGVLTMTGASEVYFVPAPASAEDGVKITLLPTNAAGTGVMRVIAGRSDANNYAFGELNITTGVIRVGTVVDSDETIYGEEATVVDTGAELQDEHTIEFCWRPGQPQSPESGAAFETPTVVSSVDWVTPEEAEVQDDVATEYEWGAGVQPSAISAGSFSFESNIPQDSTIDGIAVSVRAKYEQGSSGDPPTIEISAQLFNGAPVGDVKGPTALTTSYTEIGFGGTTDDWNAGLGYEGVTGTDFGVLITASHSEPTRTDKAFIDVIAVTIYFTTPSRTRGALQLLFFNNSDSSTTCARNYQARMPTLGTQTGIEILSGNWTFAAPYLLEYLNSVARPSCPSCTCNDTTIENCSCCDEQTGSVPEELSLGSFPGFTGDCDACGAFVGTYIIPHNSACLWTYTEQLTCGENINCESAFGPLSETFDTVTLQIYVEKITTETTCFWRARINMPGCAVVDPSNPDAFDFGIGAVYESANIDPDTEDCPELPITLSRITHDVAGLCSGTFPATLTLDEA